MLSTLIGTGNKVANKTDQKIYHAHMKQSMVHAVWGTYTLLIVDLVQPYFPKNMHAGLRYSLALEAS